MGFDTSRFMQQEFVPRTKAVPVPELKQWYDKGNKAVWVVRNLTGVEIGRANEIASKQSLSNDIIQGLLAANSKDTVDAVKALVGRTDNVPEDTAKRIEHLQLASVEPVCDLELALKLAKHFPVIFLKICNVILELSGQGASPGKSKPSGKIQKSK